MLGLRFCARAFSSCGKRGPLSSSRCAGLSLPRPLLLRSTGSRRAGSAVVAHGPSCSVACGIFPDQGSNPCALHWQADSHPLRHQGSPNLLSVFIDLLICDISYELNCTMWSFMTGFFPWASCFQGSFLLEHDQYFIPPYCQIIFHWMDVPHFIYLSSFDGYVSCFTFWITLF